LDWAKENLTAEELNKFLLATDREENSIIHEAAKYCRLDKFQKPL